MIIEEDGKKYHIPDNLVPDLPVKDITGRKLAALGLGVLAGCELINMTSNAVNFLVSCTDRNFLISMMGFSPDTLKECIQHTPVLLKLLFQSGN